MLPADSAVFAAESASHGTPNKRADLRNPALDKANVTPFLIDIKRSDVQGPLLQFQSVIFEKDELSKLVISINNRISEKNRLSDSLLERAFDVWWSHLEGQLKEIEKTTEAPKPAPSPPDEKSKILEDLLELARQQQRILNNPETLLPPEYLEFILARIVDRGPDQDIRFLREYEELHDKAMRLGRLLSSVSVSNPEMVEAARLADNLHNHLHALRDRPRRRRARLAERIVDEGKKE